MQKSSLVHLTDPSLHRAMKDLLRITRPFALIGVFLSLCLASSPVSAQTFSSPPMRVTAFTVKSPTISPRGTLAFTVRVQGLFLDLAHMGKRNIPRHGHLQYYLDRIPADAWSRADLHHSYIDSVATSKFYLALSASPVPIRRGFHHILVALAQNDNVLYHIPPRSVAIRVFWAHHPRPER